LLTARGSRRLAWWISAAASSENGWSARPARLRCADVTRDRLTIRGYISTAAKHRVDIMTALRDAMTHNPWTPPIPAPT
jgi:hypothetical protein